MARNVLHIRGEDNVKFDVNEEAVWENFFFHGISDCVNVHFVEVKRVCLGKERRWSDVAQGYPQFRGRKEAIHSTYGNQMETQSEH